MNTTWDTATIAAMTDREIEAAIAATWPGEADLSFLEAYLDQWLTTSEERSA